MGSPSRPRALTGPQPSKNRTCEFPRIRLKPFYRPISRPGCWVVRVFAFHGRECLALDPSLSPALLLPQPTIAEVAFVRRIELCGFGLNFNMPANRHATRPEQVQVPQVPSFLRISSRSGPYYCFTQSEDSLNVGSLSHLPSVPVTSPLINPRSTSLKVPNI
jgi:hypothetical protein